jgi:glutathione S-transferase
LTHVLVGEPDSTSPGHALKPVLAGREWLAGTFSVADILMSDVLRLVDRFDGLAGHPACRDYVARATARPPS